MPRTAKTLKGEINKLIDEVMHPYFKKYPITILLDALAHASIEGDTKTSLRKSLRYSAPQLIEQLFLPSPLAKHPAHPIDHLVYHHVYLLVDHILSCGFEWQ
jgi:hypothetical protein